MPILITHFMGRLGTVTEVQLFHKVMRQAVKHAFLTLFFFLFLLIELTGMTLAGKVTWFQVYSSVTSSVYRIVCSPPSVRLPAPCM